MLPKKRKFDLSTFDLERGPAHDSSSGVGTNSSVTVTVTSSRAHQPLSYTVRPPASLQDVSHSKVALPASGFLPPETVHDAFAGSSFLKSSGARDGRLILPSPGNRVRQPGGVPGGPSSNNIVDLSVSHKSHRSQVPHLSSSAFSRPSPSVAAQDQFSKARTKTVSVHRSPTVGFYVDQGKVIAVNNPDYNVERTEIISCGKQTEFGLNLSKNQSRQSRLNIDLTEWVGHRVLAVKGDIYCSGVITEVAQSADTVTVSLDGESQPSLYRDILALPGQERPPIISDVIPATNQVTVGSRFCVMLDSKRNIFVEALVYEINREVSPSQFLVKLRAEGEAGEKTWVRRAQLRLTLVPWQEEILVAAQQGNIITSSPPMTAVKTEPQTQTLPPGNTFFTHLSPPLIVKTSNNSPDLGLAFPATFISGAGNLIFLAEKNYSPLSLSLSVTPFLS